MRNHRGIIVIAVALAAICALAAEGTPADRFQYNDQQLRDPFEPLVTLDGRILPGARGAAAEISDVVVEGIIWDPQGKSVAIISGKMVKELDAVQGYQVLKIKKESVILQRGGRVIVVGLRKKGGEQDGQ
jgi:hypothetical protein